jgi:hypothetical protein
LIWALVDDIAHFSLANVRGFAISIPTVTYPTDNLAQPSSSSPLKLYVQESRRLSGLVVQKQGRHRTLGP